MFAGLRRRWSYDAASCQACKMAAIRITPLRCFRCFDMPFRYAMIRHFYAVPIRRYMPAFMPSRRDARAWRHAYVFVFFTLCLLFSHFIFFAIYMPAAILDDAERYCLYAAILATLPMLP